MILRFSVFGWSRDAFGFQFSVFGFRLSGFGFLLSVFGFRISNPDLHQPFSDHDLS